MEADGERSVHAEGTVRGRSIVVDIGGKARNQGFLRQFRPPQRQRRPSQSWWTTVTVSCENPAELRGVIESVVDVTAPDWDPRNFDPRTAA